MSLHRLPSDLDPNLLPIGARVAVTHPEFPTEWTRGKPYREGLVAKASLYYPPAKRPDRKPQGPRIHVPLSPKEEPPPKPRLFVDIEILTRRAFMGQRIVSYWSDELSLVVK